MNKIEKKLKLCLLLTGLFACNQILFTFPEDEPEQQQEKVENKEQRTDRIRKQSWEESKKRGERFDHVSIRVKDFFSPKPEVKVNIKEIEEKREQAVKTNAAKATAPVKEPDFTFESFKAIKAEAPEKVAVAKKTEPTAAKPADQTAEAKAAAIKSEAKTVGKTKADIEAKNAEIADKTAKDKIADEIAAKKAANDKLAAEKTRNARLLKASELSGEISKIIGSNDAEVRIIKFSEAETEKLKNAAFELLELPSKPEPTAAQILAAKEKLVSLYPDNMSLFKKPYEFLIEESLSAKELQADKEIIAKAKSLSNLTADQIKSLHRITIRRLTVTQIPELKTEQIQNLLLDQITAFSKEQIKVFTKDKIEKLEARFTILKPEQSELASFMKKIEARKASKK
ncbi:MAG: hypothetical protein NTZ68_03930 [Candidatus Dependentiae bacterium]|nr:hypothetical protein [Candidatus Dependentiae bacterium]